MHRSFQRTTIEAGDRRMSAVEAICSKCGHTEKLGSNNRCGSSPPEAIANRLRKSGWFIANREGKDLCPACNKTKSIPHKKETNVVELKTVATAEPQAIIVEPPREMTKEDRRLIFAKINDVYLDEKQGYSSGWSDKNVAADLGVPFAWVKNIREENFGSEGAPEEVLKLFEDAKALEKEAYAFDMRVVATINQFNVEINQFNVERLALGDKAKELATRITKLEAKFK